MQKLKAERSFCPQAFTLARRSAGPGLFIFYTVVILSLSKDVFG
jgi:hypothetical protein